MKDRTCQESPDPAEGERPEDARRRGTASARCGGEHGVAQVETDQWMERVLDPVNMEMAWKRVKRNKGAPGIDGMTIGDFPEFAREHWERIASQLRKGIYHPAPVRRVFIPKPDGTERPLGIPTVLDRVIQQATAQVLTPLWDGEFSENSFGFREGRNAHQAVRHVEGAWKLGRRHAVDCDLKAFFDTVKHDPLLAQLRAKIGGGNAPAAIAASQQSEAVPHGRRHGVKLLRLIGRYLRAGVELPDGTHEATPLGVPQGGPLSPLLANIVLDPLDKELTRRGHVFARYADDFLILVKSAKAAQRVMESVVGKQWKRPGPRRRNLLKLGANPKKVHMATRSRKGYWRMSRNKIVHQCLNNRWLKEQGVPEVREVWIKLHYGDKSRPVSVV